MGSIENRLQRLEERTPAQAPEPTPAFVKLRANLDELAALKSSGACGYRGGVSIVPEDIPGRELGPGYTHAQLLTLAAERDVTKARAETCPPRTSRRWSKPWRNGAGPAGRTRGRWPAVGLRGRLKRLEQDAREELIVIPQRAGTERRFPRSDGMEAFVNLMDRMGSGEEAPPEHPLIAAARNSSEPEWSRSFYATNSEGWTDPIEDLSECRKRPSWTGWRSSAPPYEDGRTEHEEGHRQTTKGLGGFRRRAGVRGVRRRRRGPRVVGGRMG